MSIVRCPIHDIPYNSDNPRGCPACARDEQGADQASLMQQLARSSRVLHRPELDETDPTTSSAKAAPTWPVTTPPRKPEAAATKVDQLLLAVQRRKVLAGAIATTVFLLTMLILTTGSRYVAEPYPPELTDTESVRPLPLAVNAPVTTAFAVLGPRPPRAVVDQPELQRHDYGSGLSVDAINGVIYAVRIGVPSHAWKGLRVGMPEANARGALALLGRPRVLEEPRTTRPRTMDGYRVYPSLQDVPRRLLGVEVRPPNGCFDVRVSVQPRIRGALLDGDTRAAVLGQGDAALEWVVTEIVAASRSLRATAAEPPLC